MIEIDWDACLLTREEAKESTENRQEWQAEARYDASGALPERGYSPEHDAAANRPVETFIPLNVPPVPPRLASPDDRRCCAACACLSEGYCSVARPGGLVSAKRNYRPVTDLPKRCEGFKPLPDDPDQRDGMNRWNWPVSSPADTPSGTKKPAEKRGYLHSRVGKQ